MASIVSIVRPMHLSLPHSSKLFLRVFCAYPWRAASILRAFSRACCFSCSVIVFLLDSSFLDTLCISYIYYISDIQQCQEDFRQKETNLDTFKNIQETRTHTRTNGSGRVLVGDCQREELNTHLPVMSEALSVSYADIGLFCVI